MIFYSHQIFGDFIRRPPPSSPSGRHDACVFYWVLLFQLNLYFVQIQALCIRLNQRYIQLHSDNINSHGKFSKSFGATISNTTCSVVLDIVAHNIGCICQMDRSAYVDLDIVAPVQITFFVWYWMLLQRQLYINDAMDTVPSKD